MLIKVKQIPDVRYGIYTYSVLEVYLYTNTTMRYINRRFTYLLKYRSRHAFFRNLIKIGEEFLSSAANRQKLSNGQRTEEKKHNLLSRGNMQMDMFFLPKSIPNMTSLHIA